MSHSFARPARPDVIYPDSDGEPIAENTLQFEWITTIKWGLDNLFRDRPDVFVAGDLLWYPVEGDPKTRMAPDAMVAFGRPKGYRGSYQQWLEGGIAPQVVFEVLSPGNRAGAMLLKSRFYERFGVEEYYIYDPDEVELDIFLRAGGAFAAVPEVEGFVSPRLGTRFEVPPEGLRVLGPDGRPFVSYLQVAIQRDEAERRSREAEQQRQEAEQQRQEAEQRREEAERRRDEERLRAERLAAKLRELGIDPEA